MDVNCISGQVEVIDVVYGDVTGDKNVWPNDATAILRYYVGLDDQFEVEK